MRTEQPRNTPTGNRISGAEILDLPPTFPNPDPPAAAISGQAARSRETAGRSRTLKEVSSRNINNFKLSIDKIDIYANINFVFKNLIYVFMNLFL
jgi:hypothetical protein